MLARLIQGALLLSVICLVSSCGSPPPLKIKKAPVTPVKGKVTVDGKEHAGIIIRCIPQGEFSYPELSAQALGATTNESGEFTLGTYDIADGVPPGKYALTFVWPPAVLRKQSRKSEEKSDQLGGKYSTEANSPLKITVEQDFPLELEPLDLKAK